MTVVRVVKDKNFITMGKYHLKEKDMSLKAKGLLSQMLSLPDEWDYSIVGLTKINKESYDAIRTILKELEQFGYLKRTRVKNDKGIFTDIEYTIYEKPQVDKPLLEKPIMDEPILENQTQLNTNNINNLSNEEINNNKENIKEREKIEQIIRNLNLTLGTSYRPTTPNTVKHITARLREGYDVFDFFDVINTKYEEWKGTDMEKYLRPDTLFGTKFENYLNQSKCKETN